MVWKFDEKGAKLLKINPEFKVVKEGNLTLIHPTKTFWTWAPEDRFLRSVIVDENNYVVSCGWPKFGNYGEFSEDTKLLDQALSNGDPVWFTHKEDGSLCVRSVINGQVILRTRNTICAGEFEGQSFADRFHEVAKSKYPKILDPTWMPEYFLLFEYVSPTNLLVVKYKEENLVFIGMVRHKDLSLGSWNDLEQVSRDGNLDLVRIHKLPNNAKDIFQIINTWTDEGIVARCYDSVMVKIKSPYYLAQHRFRFSISYKFVAELCELKNITSEEQFFKHIQDSGFDFEIAQTALPFWERYLKSLDYVHSLISEAQEILKNFKATNRESERKELAIKIKNERSKQFVFALYDNNKDMIKKLQEKITINEHYVEKE